ncbi:MAG: hypothetical protein HC778_03015 [Chamaesiphon sp. CSU_1_12]|nr:hypothetical protein [Chamaesiphon sp. CSU_1_12]
MYRWIQGTLVLCCSLAFFELPSLAQLPPPPVNNSPLTTPIDPQVITVRSGEILRINISKLASFLPLPSETAVFLDDLDITSQIQIEGQELVYQSSLLALPIGDRTLTIYRTTTPDRWEPVATFAVKIAPDSASIANIPQTPPIPESFPVSPSPLTFNSKFNVNIKSQIAESRSPDAGVSTRPTLLDASGTGELSAEYQIGTGKLQAKVSLVGTTFQPEALRFNELQGGASLVDLSAYSIDFTDNNNKFAIGHTCFGNNPLLVSNVCTRGISGTVKLNNFADLNVGHLSTSAIVGFDNILGIGEGNNNLTGATLGLQVANNNAGGVRLETTVMNGSRLPIASFNVGEVVDAEKSEGIGFRVTAANDDGRWRADAGFARSTFTSVGANDPQLNDGANIVLQPVTKNAWYAETSYDLFKDVKLDDNRNFSLSANLKLERTDPQFGTLGTGVNPDRLQRQYGINASIAGASIQLQHANFEDNIDNIPSLLKTKNSSNNISLSLPLQTVVQNSNPALLPLR